MNEYLSHYSAACVWNIPHQELVLGAALVNRLPNTTGEQVVDITFVDKRAVRTRKNQITHLCSHSLPNNAVQRRGDVFVSSPELMFLQFARELSFHRLVLLGLQMCSHPPGRPAEAITSVKKLSAFIKKTSGYDGHKNATYAIGCLADGSASLMESIAFMMLTLSHKFGGFGLCGANFNHEIVLPPETSTLLKQRKCFADMYYPKERVAVEYDSFSYHNSPAQQGKDMLRASALERLGIAVVRFGTIQLYDARACEDFAQNLAARLGRRIRIRTKEFQAQREALRSLLPTKADEDSHPE